MKEKVTETVFQEVKLALDSHGLPTTFPFEATTLLWKLIKLLPASRNSVRN